MSFTFKQFHIEDGRCAMKTGTDGVLLGAWVDPGNARRIVDAGCGSGLISLMLAQRTADDVQVTGVEIDAGAVADCSENFAASPWRRRLIVVQSDLLDLPLSCDMIVSNPPFFSGSLKSPTACRATARQGETLGYSSLIKYACQCLDDDGMLAMVTEYSKRETILFEAEMAGLKLRRFCAVSSRPGREPMRALWQFGRRDGRIENTELVISDNDNRYTQQFIELTKNFYLNL